MRSKNLVIAVLLIAVVAVTFSYQARMVQAEKTFSPARIGVVSVRRVFENNKKYQKWQESMNTQRDTMLADLQKLSKEIDAHRADLATRKKGSDDYIDLMRKVMEKQATLEAQQKFFEQALMTKEKVWTEEMYEEIVGVIRKVAEQKGLDIVLAQEDFKFPSESTNELLLTIKTSKVMYASEQLDITNEVLAAVDSSL